MSAHFRQQCTALLEMLPQSIGVNEGILISKGNWVQPDFTGVLCQYVNISDFSVLFIMRTLHMVQHLIAFVSHTLCRDNGCCRRRRVQYDAGIAQQLIEVRLAKRLADQFCDTLVIRQHVVMPLRGVT